MSMPAASQKPIESGKSATAFRTIGEVADSLGVPAHVLRFWETKFTPLKPVKQAGRRYYRPEDVELLRGIRELLYTDGYTIKGVQKLLRQGGIKSEVRQRGAAGSQAAGAEATEGVSDLTAGQRRALAEILEELEDLRDILKKT